MQVGHRGIRHVSRLNHSYSLGRSWLLARKGGTGTQSVSTTSLSVIIKGKYRNSLEQFGTFVTGGGNGC